MLGSGASPFHPQGLGSIKPAPRPPAPLRSPSPLPIRLGRELAVRLIHVPDAHYVLHMALLCVSVIELLQPSAAFGMKHPPPLPPQHHHRPGHLLFNLTQCAENTAVMDNQMTGHEAPCRKSNYEGFLPS